jgi:hypothetical protein
MVKRVLFLVLVTALGGVAVWGAVHFIIAKHNFAHISSTNQLNLTPSTAGGDWNAAVEKVKADRGDSVPDVPLAIPPELKHYDDRHWFLATQVAEIARFNVHTCQDYVDLAAMIERGELVTVPAVTDTYVLYGVGAKADDGPFTIYEDNRDIEIYNDAQLNEAKRQLDDRRSALNSEIAALKAQASRLNKRERAQQSDLQKQISAKQEDLHELEEDKATLDRVYGQPDSRQTLFRDYEALQKLAGNFAGRSFDLSNPSDRSTMKVCMLSSVRPEALKILEEVAAAYHSQFNRPLPVSSLIRPEQYQHVLRRVNRNAVLIETPPHSTGLAFDIDYRYMSAAEQTSVMAELARIKNEGRIEVIRERNANYHVFAFINGARPSDELITASLDKASLPVQEAQHASKPAKVKSQPQKSRRGKSPKRR